MPVPMIVALAVLAVGVAFYVVVVVRHHSRRPHRRLVRDIENYLRDMVDRGL